MSYETKFKTFIDAIAKLREDGTAVMVVHHPQVLGDDYEEIVESLNRLADGGIALTIVPRSKR